MPGWNRTLLRPHLKLLRDGRLGPVQHGLNLFSAVGQSCGKFEAASEFLDHLEAVGSSLALLVNVGNTAKKWAQNDFGVVFKEVDL